MTDTISELQPVRLTPERGLMTYDQWKTTDPREYEREQDDDPPTELDLAYDRIIELEGDLKAAGETSAARIKELDAALLECLAYFKDKYDVVDGDHGEQLPNKEMRLGTMIDETLYGIRF